MDNYVLTEITTMYQRNCFGVFSLRPTFLWVYQNSGGGFCALAYKVGLGRPRFLFYNALFAFGDVDVVAFVVVSFLQYYCC